MGQRKNWSKRRKREKLAKSKGDHSIEEWERMKSFFDNTCANCFGEKGLKFVEKDHIIPLYQGGSNSIKNIQPLCAKCNCGKGSDTSDLRPRLAKYLGKELPENYKGAY